MKLSFMKETNFIKQGIILLALLVCISTCCINEPTNDRTIKISVEAKQWAPYELGQKVIFEADTSVQHDTLEVTHRVKK